MTENQSIVPVWRSWRRVRRPSSSAWARALATYYVRSKTEGRDDLTGEELILRDDDREETVRKRLEVYHAQTRQLVDYYGNWAAGGAPGAPKYRKIAGIGPVDTIRDRAFEALR